MGLKNTPVIATQRLLLRGKRRSDAAGMLNYYLDPMVRPWLGGYPPDDLWQVRKMVSSNQSVSSFVIIERQSNKVIGEIDLYNVIQGRLASIGYILLSEYWGMGYMTEAATEILRLGFIDMRLDRIRACIMKNNTKSRRLVEKMDFEFESEMKEADFGGRVEDVCYYSLSRERYLAKHNQSTAK